MVSWKNDMLIKWQVCQNGMLIKWHANKMMGCFNHKLMKLEVDEKSFWGNEIFL